MPNINPYQPPSAQSDNLSFDGRLAFDGIIEEEDYRNLLEVSNLERWVWIALGLLLIIIVLPICVMGIVFQLRSGDDFGAVIVSLLLVATLGMLVYIKRGLGTVAIAKRKLNQYPDLLSVAKGEFTAEGMLFYDGKHHFWFSPWILKGAIISERGIRVGLDVDRYRFLAITRRMIPNFTLPVAHRLLVIWWKRSMSGQPPSWDMWNQIGQAPEQAVAFQYEIQSPTLWPNQTPGPPTWKKLAGQLFLFVLAIVTWNGFGKWLMLIIGISWFFQFASRVPGLKKYFALSKPLTQFGWITADELATYHQLSGVRISRSEFQLEQPSDDLVMVHMFAQQLPIQRSTLTNPEDWERLCQWATQTKGP